MAFRKILLAVDGSPNSRLAVRHAINMARCSGGHVVLLHCQSEIPSLVGGSARAALLEEIHKEAEAMLAIFREDLREEGVNFSMLLVHGKPHDAIVRAAEEENCDVIVMGSRGLSDFEGMLVGSVAHRVLSLAHVPVLISR